MAALAQTCMESIKTDESVNTVPAKATAGGEKAERLHILRRS